MLPFLTFNAENYEQARVGDLVGVHVLSSPGGLAEWFGFCAIYFAISGLEANRFTYRVGAWVAAVGSVFIVALTVGRSTIFGVAAAITIGFRGVLKRGFVPLLALIILSGVAYESGLFDQAISRYTERGMEETGRELLWPAAIERIFASPLFGVGMSNVNSYVMGIPAPPHNSFLYFALSSGVVPLAFYVAFWIQAAWSSAVHAKGGEADSFRLPYLVFIFVVVMFGDSGFMSPPALLALSVAAGSGVVYGKKRLLVVRVGNKVKFAPFPAKR
jgi:O-antigen ligase